MTINSNSINNNQNNNALIAKFLAKMKAEEQEVAKLVAKLGPLAKNLALLKMLLKYWLGQENSPLFGREAKAEVAKLQAEIAQTQDQIKGIEAQLKAIDPGLTDLCNAINDLIADMTKMGGNGGDLSKFNDYLTKILQAFQQKLIVDLYRDKMNGDTNNAERLKDAMAVIQASEQENLVLCSLQKEMMDDLYYYNNQANEAKNWLAGDDHWYDKVRDFFDSSGVDREKAKLHNAEEMTKMILQIMADIGPEIAATQSAIYDEASLALQKIIQEIEKLLADPTISNSGKADQVKYLLGLALGILTMVQTDAAKEKAEDAKAMSKSGIAAATMNISNSQAELKRLEKALAYANLMGKIMKVVQPMLEIGGCLLAPGIGAFMVMAAFAASSQFGLSDKMTKYLAEHGFGEVGAQAFMAGAELVACCAGGAGLDKLTTSFAKTAGDNATRQLAVETTELINEAVSKTLIQANKVGEQASEIAVRETITSAVTKSSEAAAQKAVLLFDKQSVLSMYSQGISTLRENIAKAVEIASQTAADNVSLLAAAAADGARVTEAQISVVADQAANSALANVSNLTPAEVAEATASRVGKKAAGAILFAAFNNGLLSSLISYEMKKHGHDETSITQVMDIMKIIEQILGSLSLMYGTGVAGVITSGVKGSSSLMLTIGSAGQAAGLAADTVAAEGQAEATMAQSDAVAAINKSSVSNDLIQNLLHGFNQQRNIDNRHLAAQASEASSNFTLMGHMNDNLDALARALATQAV